MEIKELAREELEARYIDALIRLQEAMIRLDRLLEQVNELNKKSTEYFVEYAEHCDRISKLESELDKCRVCDDARREADRATEAANG